MVVEKANDISNPSTNQQAEGMMNSEKTHVPDMRKHASDPGAYMHHRWKSLKEASKLVVTETEKVDEKLDKRKALEDRYKKRSAKAGTNEPTRINKKIKPTGEIGKEKTKDEKEMEMEDETDMVHDRHQGWKVDNENIKLDLLRALEQSGKTYVKTDNLGHKTYNMSAIQGILSKHAANNMTDVDFVGKKKKFMSKPRFNEWWEGNYHKKLDKANIDTVRSFVCQYEFTKEFFM